LIQRDNYDRFDRVVRALSLLDPPVQFPVA